MPDIHHRKKVLTGAKKFNKFSVLFDGVDEHINIDAVQTALASTTVGTWSFWVKPVDATPAGAQMILTFNDTSANEFIQLSLATTGKINITARLAGSNKWVLNTDAAALSDDTWALITLVQDGIAPVLYVNRVAVAQTLSGTDRTVWYNDLTGLDNGRIADRIFNEGSESVFFNGNMDEVLFINRDLTAAQVLDIYNGGCPKDESGIANGVSYFRFDGDILNTATDSIGTNDGTYVNMEQNDVEDDVPC